MDKEGLSHTLPLCLLVDLAQGPATADEAVPVQRDMLPGVLLSIRLQPGQMLRTFVCGCALVRSGRL